MKKKVKLGELVGPVTAVVERTDRCWVSVDQPRDELMDKLESLNLLKMQGEPQKGDMAAAVFAEDGAVYRVVILEAGKKCKVRYCDYGNEEMIGAEELLELPEKLAKVEPLATSVRIAGVDGVGDSPKNRAKVQKKLSGEGLKVTLEEMNGDLVGIFEAGGKKIKFSKSKDQTAPGVTQSKVKEEVASPNSKGLSLNMETISTDVTKVDASSEKVSKPDKVEARKDDRFGNVSLVEKVSSVEVPKSTGKQVMFHQLPGLKLLEGVEISGTVVYVSPENVVSFSPQWIQASLSNLTDQIDHLFAKNKLQVVDLKTLKVGALCIAKSTADGALYRARVIKVSQEISVQFIDFGDLDCVGPAELYSYAEGLEMLAPAAADILLARELQSAGKLPKEKVREIVEDRLTKVENLVLILDTEQSGNRLGRFYEDGREIKWDNLVETKSVFDKKANLNLDEENNADVVIESETVIQEEIKVKTNKKDNSVQKHQDPHSETMEKKSSPKRAALPVAEVPPLGKVPSKLYKLVPADPPAPSTEIPVFLGHVESASSAWLYRTEDEVRVSLLMDKLDRLAEANTLQPAKRYKKGAVYGARYSNDGNLYRAVLLGKEEKEMVSIRFFDFGNSESIQENKLLDIPKEVAEEPAGAFLVNFESKMDDTCENMERIDAILGQDGLTVCLDGDNLATFKCNGKLLFAPVDDMEEIEKSTEELEIKVPDEEKKEIVNEESKTKHEESVPFVHNSKEITSDMSGFMGELEEGSQPPKVGNRVKDQVRSSEANVECPSKLENENEADSRASVPVQVFKSAPIPPPRLESAAAESGRVSAGQPVLTRNFTKAITELQSQLLRPSSTDQAELGLDRKSGLEWQQGDCVVARWPDQIWRKAEILQLDIQSGQAMVASLSNTSAQQPVSVPLDSLRSPSLPVETLNMIDKSVTESCNVRQKGDGAVSDRARAPASLPSAVGKVKDWFEKNDKVFAGPKVPDQEEGRAGRVSLGQLPLPPSRQLASYSMTGKGSSHIQAVVDVSKPGLSASVLAALLTGPEDLVALLTCPKSSYVVQKLITVLAPAQLLPLIVEVTANFTALCLDSTGCRVVQTLLEYSDREQQRRLSWLLCQPGTLVTLAGDKHGTYVAQAMLPHMATQSDCLLKLVSALLGNSARLGSTQSGSYFMQRLLGLLSTHYPASGAELLLQDELVGSLAQLGTTEPGSRLLQACLAPHCPSHLLVRAARWAEQNMAVVVVTKPAVFLCLAVLDNLTARLDQDLSWRTLLDRLVKSLLRDRLLLTAALHPAGHLLAKEVVSKLDLITEESKSTAMKLLASAVDQLSTDKLGATVLKELADYV